MTKKDLMKGIRLPLEGQNIVIEYNMPEDRYNKWKELFYQNTQQFFNEVETQKDKEQLLLYLYISFAADLYDKFREQEIKDKIYFDTFYDFTIWYQCCKKKRHKAGLMEEKWLSLPLKLRIFRLGRLQFEKGEGVLHVHIPEGEPLSEELCEDAFLQAEAFFDKSYTMYDCDSWLLSPHLSEVLDVQSNILKFQRRFQIEKVTYPFRQAEERIFGRVLERKEDYPEETSLQRRAKAYVLGGRDLGIGYGVIYR